MCCVYIYSLYIWSPGLPITRGSTSSMTPSSSAAPGSGGYKNTPGRQRLAFSEGDGSLGRASGVGGFFGRASDDDPRGQRRWRVEAGGRQRRSWCGQASADDAPKLDERWQRTLGPVVTAVARDAVGFGSTGSGPKGARRWWILEERTWRRILEERARCRLLGGTRPGVAPAGVPPLATMSTFPRREQRRWTSLGGEWWRIDDPVFMLFYIHISANINRFLWYIIGLWLSFHLLYVYDISIHSLCKYFLILCSVPQCINTFNM
jgi:hypothetical protein